MKSKNLYPFNDVSLSVEERVRDLVSRLKTDEKLGLLSTRQKAVPRFGIEEWRVGTEVARGYVGRGAEEHSTVFPQPIGLASTFDTELMKELGEIAGNEARIYNKKFPHTKLMLWGPTVDLCRHPLWGRNEEGYGEDPVLTGEMSTAYTLGMRGNDKNYLKTIPTLKHFCANNHEEDRGTDSANIEPRTKHEYYYAAFEPSIRAGGAFSMMTAYNELSGVPAINNPDLQKICKDKWGLGFVVTDGGDFIANVLSHRFSSSHAETLALALKAGNDVMTDSSETTFAAGKEALKLGYMTEDDVDKAISNVLTYRFRLGEFDPKENNPFADIPDELLNCDEYKATNLRAAKESVTLLKNNNLLPLSRDKIKKLAVIGPTSFGEFHDWYTGYSDYNVSVVDGLKDYLGAEKILFDDGYDHVAVKAEVNGKYLEADTVEQGAGVFARAEKPVGNAVFKKLDWGDEIIFSALETGKMLRDDGKYLADSESIFEWYVRETLRPEDYNGKTYYKSWNKNDVRLNEDLQLVSEVRGAVDSYRLFEEEVISDGACRAAKLASEADAVVVCLGNDPMMGARECYDRKSLKLNTHQQKLIDEVKKVNKNVILLIVSSYPFSINTEQNDDNVPAIIYTAHGGPEMGNAISEVLFGGFNPAGRTCQTWYKSELDLPSLKDYDIIDGGFTYLYFKGTPLYPFGHGLSYSSFAYDNLSVADDGANININLDVKNTSKRDGDEVVQIYFSIKNPSVRRPIKTLCAFRRVNIKTEESVRLVFKIDKEKLRFYEVGREKFTVESGDYTFYAGSSSADIRVQKSLFVKGETVPERSLGKTTPAINYNGKKQVKMCWSKELEKHYILGNGWNSEFYFNNVAFDNVGEVVVKASLNSGEGKIEFYLDDNKEPSAVIEIPACANPCEFKKYHAVFNEKISDTHNLTLKFSTGLNLLDIKLK